VTGVSPLARGGGTRRPPQRSLFVGFMITIIVAPATLVAGSDGWGHSANAVRWQVQAALLVYVLLRFLAHLWSWGHRFTRLFVVPRSALLERLDLLALLKSYGTAMGAVSCDRSTP